MDTRGNRLTDRSRNGQVVVFLLMGAVFTVVGALIGRTSATEIDDGSFQLIPDGIGLLLAAVGLFMVLRGLRVLWLRYLFGTPTLILPEGDILLGDTAAARFERSGGSRRARTGPRQITARLICRETVRYRRGTDTETATHDVRTLDLQVAVDDHPTRVVGHLALAVPTDWPPTIMLPRNEVQTIVEILVQASGLPEDRSSFTVPVRPALRAGAM